jgi:hypothetical protein
MQKLFQIRLTIATVLLTNFAYANMNIKSLNIFKNNTFITQELNLKAKNTELLGKVNVEDIKFITNEKCLVDNIVVNTNENTTKKLNAKIVKAKEKIAYKVNEIKSIKATLSQLKNIRFTGDAVKLKNIKGVSFYVKQEVKKNHNLLYKYDLDVKLYKDNLEKLLETQKTNIYSVLEYTASCEVNATLNINYPIANVEKVLSYEIDANTDDKTINIKNQAYITQNLGHDLKDIEVNMYNYHYSNLIHPDVFSPIYLDEKVISRKLAYGSSKKRIVIDVPTMKKTTMHYNEAKTRAYSSVSNVSLLSGNKTAIVFSNDTYAMKDKIEIDAFTKSQAFYRVDFTSNRLYMDNQKAKLYLDSEYIGEKNISKIQKDKNTRIYFGIDNLVSVSKELTKDIKEEPFFSMSTLKTQKVWNYTIENKHANMQNISFIQRLPVSKNEKIIVELNSEEKFLTKEANGKINYEFSLDANQSKVIEYGYTITRPYKK